MSEWVDIPLATQQGEEESTYASDAELINLMLKDNPPGSRAPFHITSVPTLSTSGISTPTTGSIRGICFHPDRNTLYVVQGTSIYRGAASSWTLVGTMPGTANCRMVYTGTHIVIVDGTNARCVVEDGSSVVTPTTEGWIDVAYQDGYTIYADTDSDSVYVSNLDDPTTIGALNFTTVDALSGSIVGIMSDHRELFVYKTSSIEHFYNSGTGGFPFVRSSPGIVEVGAWNLGNGSLIYGTNTIARYAGTRFWVGNDLRVYMSNGYKPMPISTPWVERYLRTNVTAVPLYGAAFEIDGRVYYLVSGFSVSGVRVALVYDVKLGFWHRRYSPVADALMITHVLSYYPTSLPVVAARNAGTLESTLYHLDPAGTNDTGAAAGAVRTMTLPQYAPTGGGKRVFMPEVYLDMAKTTDAATMTLSWSDDGGTTYTSGLSGTSTNPRSRWQRLGSFYQRILRFTITVANKLTIFGVRARVEVGE